MLHCSCVFSPFSIAITSLGEERANLSAFRTFVRFAFVWFCLFPLPLGVWEGLRFVIVALPGLFSYLLLLCFGRSVWYCDMGKNTGCFVVRYSVTCDLTVILCLIFILVPLEGFLLCLCHFLDIFFTILHYILSLIGIFPYCSA